MDKSAFRAALDAELGKTRAAVAELRELTAPVAPDEAIGRVSRMDAINNKAINDAALRKAEEKLRQLERMTVLVDEPGFGLCKKCGEAIPMQRLVLMPQSVFCVRCASWSDDQTVRKWNARFVRYRLVTWNTAHSLYGMRTIPGSFGS